jgi:hypothetical protein
MSKRFRHAAVLACRLTIPISLAFAQGEPPWGWGWRQAPPYGDL